MRANRQSARADGAMAEPRRCSRCEFLHEERIPVGEDGLCLWCRMALAGVDPHDFYTSGEWMNEIEWRGDETPGDALRRRIRERMGERGDTIKRIAQRCGICESGLFGYMHKVDRRATQLPIGMARGLAQYLDMPIEQLVKLVGGPRYVWGMRRSEREHR